MRDKKNNKEFALKVISLKETRTIQAREEFYFSAITDCPNILPCFALYRYEMNCAILQELMWDTLGKFIKIETSQNEVVISYIIRELTKGLDYLHRNHRIHRDLKSDNVFISLEAGVKIGDFGLSAQLTAERDLRETFAGSPLWMCPEILLNQQYSVAADIWSLGIISFEIANKHTPFHKCKTIQELTKMVTQYPEPKLEGGFSESYKEFVALCLKKNPNERKTSAELLQSSFLSNINESEAKNLIFNLIRR